MTMIEIGLPPEDTKTATRLADDAQIPLPDYLRELVRIGMRAQLDHRDTLTDADAIAHNDAVLDRIVARVEDSSSTVTNSDILAALEEGRRRE
jgi:hypothetical protein